MKKNCQYIVPDNVGTSQKIEVLDLSSFRNQKKMEDLSRLVPLKLPVARAILSNKKIENLDNDFLAKLYKSQLKNIHHPMEYYQSTQNALKFCADFFNTNQNVGIYGDYDGDGVTSSLIMYETLKKFLSTDRIFSEFSRVGEDGFGLSLRGAQAMVANNCKLVFVLDTGSSSEETLQFLVDNNIQVIVLDHHPILDGVKLVNSVIYIDPHLFVSSTPNPEELRNAGLTWFFGRSLLEYMGEDTTEYYKYPLAISAIGTVADAGGQFEGVHNRGILYEGLSAHNLETIPFFRELFKVEPEEMFNDLSHQEISRGYRILSLAKRSKNIYAGDIYTLLNLDSSIQQRVEIIKNLNNKYEEFLTLVDQATDELISRIDVSNNIIIEMANPNIVPSEYIGMSGTLASRILSRLKKPAIIFIQDDDGTLKGSWRTGDLNGSQLLLSIKQNNPKIIETFGGHSMAGGLLIKSKRQLIPLRFLANDYLLMNGNTFTKREFFNNPNVEKRFVTTILDNSNFLFEDYQELKIVGPFNRYELRNVSLLLINTLIKYNDNQMFFTDSGGTTVLCHKAPNNIEDGSMVDLLISFHIMDNNDLSIVYEHHLPTEYRLEG